MDNHGDVPTCCIKDETLPYGITKKINVSEIDVETAGLKIRSDGTGPGTEVFLKIDGEWKQIWDCNSLIFKVAAGEISTLELTYQGV